MTVKFLFSLLLLFVTEVLFCQQIASNKIIQDHKKQIQAHKKYENVVVPKFSLPDTSGRITRLDSIKKRILVFHFWYISCPPCKQEMPYFKKVIDYYKDTSSIKFISICVDKGINKNLWKQSIRQYDLNATHVFVDRDKPIKKENEFYRKIDSYPTYMIVSAYKSLGSLTNADFIPGFIYEIERARQGVTTAQAYIEMSKSEKKFNEWLKQKLHQFEELKFL